jgi:3-oxoacyl-[acyl-carrier protein] reductase
MAGAAIDLRGERRDKNAPVNRYDFDGRVALVTGGASGIGAATVERLRAGGARVAVFDRARAEGDVLAIQGDVTRSAEADAAVARVVDELGSLDVLVNSAGVPGQSLGTLEVPDEEWKRVFAINAHGTFWFCRAAARVMVDRGYGRIVNVASIAGKEGNPPAAAYSGSKAAVIGFTKSIGKDLAGTGVLVNCIAPAVIETPILEGLTQQHIDYMVERIPLGRLGKPEEVASLICWLASEEMSFSTGACFDISGGRAVY